MGRRKENAFGLSHASDTPEFSRVGTLDKYDQLRKSEPKHIKAYASYDRLQWLMWKKHYGPISQDEETEINRLSKDMLK